MEEQRHLESTGSLPWYRHDRSSEPRRGAGWRMRSRLGLRQEQSHPGGTSPGGSLPAIRCLANELCAQRGFDIQTHGHIPSGGTILSVDELNFDRALVLLSLFASARVYMDQDAVAPTSHMRALSLRSVSERPTTELLCSIVGDLVHERAVILGSTQAARLQESRALLTPVLRVRVEFGAASRVQVFAEN